MGLSHVKIAKKKTFACQATGSSWGHRDERGFTLFKELAICKETKADVSQINLIMTL